MSRKTRIAGGLFLLLAVAAFVIVNPFKVTDPSDPRFDPDKFKFSNYSYDDDSLRDAFQKLFPIGTPKDFVDRVLVDAGGATGGQGRTLKELYSYYEPKGERLRHLMKGPPHYNFIFNEDNTVNNIYLGSYLYPGQLTINDLEAKWALENGIKQDE